MQSTIISSEYNHIDRGGVDLLLFCNCIKLMITAQLNYLKKVNQELRVDGLQLNKVRR